MSSSYQNILCIMLVSMITAAAIVGGSPVKDSASQNDSPIGNGLGGDDVAISALWESNQDSISRFVNDPIYRAGYQRAVYDLYTGRYPDLFTRENTFSVPSKKAIDLGLGRFNSGSRAGNSLMALDSARFAGGPGRK